MNDDELMEQAAKTAQEMHEIFNKNIKENTQEYVFKFGTYCFSTLLADFVDAIVLNKYPDKKIELMKQIFHMSSMLLQVKDSERQNNPGEKH